MNGCEMCGCPRVSWRGGAHVCTVCWELFELWARDKDPRPMVTAFIASALSESHGGPLEAARARTKHRLENGW